jgi:transposase
LDAIEVAKETSMKKVSSMETTATAAAVGIDVGDRFSHWCALRAAGEVIGRGRVRTTAEAIATQAPAWRGARVAIENGTHSGWISRALSAAGCLTTVANPSRWRGTAHASKNDRNDAEALARVVRVDPRLLFPIQHRSQTHQQDLIVIRSRAQLVKTRTQLVNTARSQVKSLGARLPRTDAAAFHTKTWNHVPPPLRPALAPFYRILAALSQEIGTLDDRIEQLSQQRYPHTARLRSVPGVGPITALTYVLTVADPHRFSRSRDAGAYLGLRPKQRQSGDRDPQLGIAKNGDRYLRSLLVECAHYLLSRGPDSALKQWGLRLAQGGRGVKRRALVAVARKLAVLLHRLWISGDTFRPFPHAVPEETVDAEMRAHRSLGAAAAA